MSPTRLQFLVPIQCLGVFDRAWLLALFFVCGVAALTAGIDWNGQCVRLFGVTEDGYRTVTDRDAAVQYVLANYFGWAWIFACLGYVLPTVLLPLAASFSLTHTVWLKTLPCRPREVAAARACRLAAAVGVVAGLSLLWVAVVCAYHDLPVRLLLTAVLGCIAHLLLAGGLLLTFGPWLTSGTERTAAAFAAMLAPVVLLLVYLGFAHKLGDGGFELWFPYAAPHTHIFDSAWKHYVSAAAVGAGLVVWSLVAARGRMVIAAGTEQEGKG